jgi:hypothetical protein
MRAHLRSLLIFLGAGMSAAMLAFVSLSRPYTGPQIGMLVIGSVIAGAATAAVEQGLGNKGPHPTPLPPPGGGGGPGGSVPGPSGAAEPGAAGTGTGSIDYHALLTRPEAAAQPRSAEAPPIGREQTFAAIARLLTGQQEVGG